MPRPPDLVIVIPTDTRTIIRETNTSLSHTGGILIFVRGRERIPITKLNPASTIQRCGWPGTTYTRMAAEADQIRARW
jgi:hypothetical protein